MTNNKPLSEDAIKSICLRCHRAFTPKKEGQLYGEKCIRKLRGQTVLQDRYLVGPKKRRQKKPASFTAKKDDIRPHNLDVVI